MNSNQWIISPQGWLEWPGIFPHLLFNVTFLGFHIPVVSPLDFPGLVCLMSIPCCALFYLGQICKRLHRIKGHYENMGREPQGKVYLQKLYFQKEDVLDMRIEEGRQWILKMKGNNSQPVSLTLILGRSKCKQHPQSYLMQAHPELFLGWAGSSIIMGMTSAEKEQHKTHPMGISWDKDRICDMQWRSSLPQPRGTRIWLHITKENLLLR